MLPAVLPLLLPYRHPARRSRHLYRRPMRPHHGYRTMMALLLGLARASEMHSEVGLF